MVFYEVKLLQNFYGVDEPVRGANGLYYPDTLK